MLHRWKQESPIPTQNGKRNLYRGINAVWYILPDHHEEQGHRNNIRKESPKILKTGSHKDLIQPYQYFSYRNNFTKMLSQVESMWDGHFGSFKAASYLIEP